MIKKLLALLLILLPATAFAFTIPEGRAFNGDVTITNGVTRTEDSIKSNITVLSTAGTASTTLASVSSFATSSYVLLYQVQGTGAGNYEIQKIGAKVGLTLFFTQPLVNTYQATKAEVIQIKEYHSVTVNSGGSWTASAWDGTTGGILIALLNGTLTEQSYGTTTVAGLGFAGGGGGGHDCGAGNRTSNANQGDSSTGTGAANSGSANGMGGGGIYLYAAGGGYATGGGSADASTGGGTGGVANLLTMFFGGAGGGSDSNACQNGGSGGSSGGIIFISSINTTLSGGLFSSNGNNGGIGSRFPLSDGVDGAAAAGGSIYLPTKLTLALGSGIVTAGGGTATNAGAGGVGRISTLATTTVSGTASPTINTTSNNYIYNIDNDAVNMNLASSI